MAYTNPLIFKNSEKVKEDIINEQRKEIANLFYKWSAEMQNDISKFASPKNFSEEITMFQKVQLNNQLQGTASNIMMEINNIIEKNIYLVSQSVVYDASSWLTKFGFDESKMQFMMTSVPQDIVEKLTTGQIYDSGWSLSKALWSSNEEALKHIYEVVAKGVALNMPIVDIAKALEAFVDPEHRKPWNLTMKDGTKIYPRQIDYNAQRLARTLVQHSYQQSFVAATEKNPFILSYQWSANGSRVCDLCLDRDGAIYEKDELPLDHPNGMCTMVPVVSSTMTEDLNNWLNGEYGDYPEIDEFAKNFGYNQGDDKKSIYNPESKIKEEAKETFEKIKALEEQKKINEVKADLSNFQLNEKMEKRNKLAYDMLFENYKRDFGEEFSAWVNSLEDYEKRAVTTYTSSSYKLINTALRRDGISNIPEDNAILLRAINDIDSALKKSKLDEVLITNRGSSLNSFASMFDLRSLYDFTAKAESLDKDTIDEKVQYILSNAAGKVGMDQGFFSTTINPDMKKFRNEVEFVITLPEGTNAAYIAGLSSFEEEEEVLVARDTKFVLTGVENLVGSGQMNGLIRVYLQAIVD